MRLRRPCEHDRYDEHVNIGKERPTDVIPSNLGWCPGGEFLPEDAIVIEGGFSYTIRCEACELVGCHVGVNGGHDDLDNPAVHTRDVWVLTTLTEEQAENWDLLAADRVGEPG